MARPISPAMVSTLILGSFLASSSSGIVLVTTTCVMADFEMFSIAGGENTGCEQQAYTAVAPFSISADAVFTSVPAVSIRSSMTKQVRLLTSLLAAIT